MNKIIDTMRYNGHDIIIVPDVVVKKRTWKERLFTFPWKPFKMTKKVPNPSSIKDGEFFAYGTKYYCNKRTYNELIKRTNVEIL